MTRVRFLFFVSAGEFPDDVVEVHVNDFQNFRRLLGPRFDILPHSIGSNPDRGFPQVALEVVFHLLLTVLEFVRSLHLADDGTVQATVEVLDREVRTRLVPLRVPIRLCPELVVEEFQRWPDEILLDESLWMLSELLSLQVLPSLVTLER